MNNLTLYGFNNFTSDGAQEGVGNYLKSLINNFGHKLNSQEEGTTKAGEQKYLFKLSTVLVWRAQ